PEHALQRRLALPAPARALLPPARGWSRFTPPLQPRLERGPGGEVSPLCSPSLLVGEGARGWGVLRPIPRSTALQTAPPGHARVSPTTRSARSPSRRAAQT